MSDGRAVKLWPGFDTAEHDSIDRAFSMFRWLTDVFSERYQDLLSAMFDMPELAEQGFLTAAADDPVFAAWFALARAWQLFDDAYAKLIGDRHFFDETAPAPPDIMTLYADVRKAFDTLSRILESAEPNLLALQGACVALRRGKAVELAELVIIEREGGPAA